MKDEINQIPFIHNYDPLTKKITLRGARFIPDEIFEFSDQIEILDASAGSLTGLPNRFPELTNLRIAFFSNNLFEEIPQVLSECNNLAIVGFKACRLSKFAENALPAQLRWLILSHNALTKLPSSIGHMRNLEKFSISGNQIESLPDEMARCTSLELLRISANNFQKAPPDWLFTLPRLSWYGDNGNPFGITFHSRETHIHEYSWADIERGEIIGESPSSCVYRGKLKVTGQEVAIKIFKGNLTSDGYPADDMRSCIAAGRHKNLIEILGRLAADSENREGLILSLIPTSYKSLGLPPNFKTCTRDTFAENTVFSMPFIEKVLQEIAAACIQIHKNGLMHGDLYAHNILTNSAGDSYLGDFGAASFYDRSTNSIREQIDVRAFGCLIDDLLLRRMDKSDESMVLKLNLLKEACMNRIISNRPRFSDIFSILQGDSNLKSV